MSSHETTNQTQQQMVDTSLLANGMLQRKCSCGQHTIAGGECEACREKREGTIQHAAVSPISVSTMPPTVNNVLDSPGQALDDTTRAFMEARFGRDFSQVRVHTAAQAAESAKAFDAQAYTIKDDVVFGAEKYAPETEDGKKLLAHELTHVVEQGVPPAKRTNQAQSNPYASRETSTGMVQEQSKWNSPFQKNLWGGEPIRQDNPYASKETFAQVGDENCSSLYLAGNLIQFQKEQPAPKKGWEPCVMPGKREGLDPVFLGKLDNICGRMEAIGYGTRIAQGVRTLDYQVEVYAKGRSFQDFKDGMQAEVKKGHITAQAAQKWIDYYDPKVGKHPMPFDPDIKGPVTWTLKSVHLVSKAADVVDPKLGCSLPDTFEGRK